MLENLCFLIEQFSIIACLYALYGKKLRLDFYTMSVMLINVIILFAKHLGYVDETTTILIAIIIFVYTLYEFDKNIKLAIINNVLYLFAISIFQLISAFVVALMKSVIKNENLVLIVANLLILIGVLLIGKKFYVISNYINNRKWLSIVPIFICCAMIIILLLKYKSYKYLQFEIYAISMVFIILVIVLIQKWFESKAELEEEQVYNDAFKSLVNDVRRKQHDVKNHLNAIYSQHYTHNTYESLVESQKEYCDLLIQTSKYDKLLSIPIPILAGFLYSKFLEIENKGVDVDYNIRLTSSSLSIPLHEVISILGILLDNALEKVEDSGKYIRKIKFEIIETNKLIEVYVKNPSEYINHNMMMQMFEEGVSSKGENRGIGLCNVKEKSRKYQFNISVQNEIIGEKNWISFCLIFHK